MHTDFTSRQKITVTSRFVEKYNLYAGIIT